MSKTTVFGVACRVGAVVPLRTRSGKVTGGYAINDLDPILGGAAVDLDHNPAYTVGRIVHAEISENDTLGLVCVLDGDDVQRIDGDIFYSGTFQPSEPYERAGSFTVDRARLAGVSLTFTPANQAALPISWMPGDIGNGGDRSGWPMSWKHDYPLLAAALDHQPDSWRTRTATRVLDRRYDDEMPTPSVLRAIERGRPPGTIRHAAVSRGGVLRVR